MGITRSVEEAIKVWIALGGVGIALLGGFVSPRATRGALVALTLVAAAVYVRFDPKLVATNFDSYDVLHYYLNAKYFPELGYADLYPACVTADHETGGPKFREPAVYMEQSLGTDVRLPFEQIFDRGRAVKEKFTPERWAAFSHDFVVLQRLRGGMNNALWGQMLQDHGYNGTPVWTAIARPLASAVPVEWIKVLCSIDLVLLGLAITAVVWAYGVDAALWTALFLFVTYSGRWPVYSWAFLRYDYVSALVIAMCAIKRGHPFVAGLLTGFAATLRLFPALWMVGPGLKGVAGLIERKVHRPLLVVLAGFLLSVAVLEGFAAASLGPATIGIHLSDMSQHTEAEQLSSRRIGLDLALAYRGTVLPKNLAERTKREIGERRPLRWVLAGGILVGLGFALRRAGDDEAYAYGFVPFFLITTASYYYYVTRLTLVVLHAGNLRTWRHRIGLATLFGLESFTNLAETQLPEHRVFLIGWLSWGLLAYTLVMIGLTIRDHRSPETSP